MFFSCKTKSTWENADVTYYDDFSKSCIVRASKNSYYNFIRAKNDEKGKIEILIPEEIKLVEGKSSKYMGMYFDEETYGMESYSFGKCLAGDSIMIVETKFQAKTCACKTSGTYFKGYFLVYNDTILKIKTDSKNNVYNRKDIYDFVSKFSEVELSQNINTIDDIILFLENINN